MKGNKALQFIRENAVLITIALELFSVVSTWIIALVR